MPKDSPERGPLLADLAESFYFTSDLDHCIARLDELLPLARAAGDRSLETWAGFRKAELGFLADPRGTTIEVFRAQALDAISTFEELGDDGRLAGALTVLAECGWLTGAADEMLRTSERALSLARRAKDWRTIPLAASYLGRALVLGATPCSEAEERLRSLIDELEGERMAQATCRLEIAIILAMLERFDEARGHVAFSRSVFEDLGQRRWLAAVSGMEGLVASAEGKLDEAERRLRSGYGFFQRQHDTANAVAAAADLSQVLCELGRFDEAGALADEVAKGAGIYDLEEQVGWRCVKARVLASRGEFDEAEALARRALELIRPTEFLDLQGDALVHLARCSARPASRSDAAETLQQAIDAYERKGGPRRRTSRLATGSRRRPRAARRRGPRPAVRDGGRRPGDALDPREHLALEETRSCASTNVSAFSCSTMSRWPETSDAPCNHPSSRPPSMASLSMVSSCSMTSIVVRASS